MIIRKMYRHRLLLNTLEWYSAKGFGDNKVKVSIKIVENAKIFEIVHNAQTKSQYIIVYYH